MLIPFGILSAAAAGEFTSDYELIATAFGTGSSGVITFSSIPQEYKHLQIRYTGKNTSTGSNLQLRFNGITSGVYMRHTLLGDGSSVSSSAGATSADSIVLGNATTEITTANVFAGGVIDILDYTSTTKNKTIRALYGFYDATRRIHFGSGLYAQTTAVSSLTISTLTFNLTSSSRFSLYGIRG
jgi:hypothetical protein